MIAATYFDGHSARGQAVRLSADHGHLIAEGDGEDGSGNISQRWPLAQIHWPERTRHGQRLIQLPGGGALQVMPADAVAFDTWRQHIGAHDSWVVRWQQSWRATLAAALTLVALIVVGYLWGVPLAARVVVSLLPATLDQAVGESALQQLSERWLKTSALPAERQAGLRLAFDTAVLRAYPTAPPHYVLRFAAADKALGANAFALPGGTIVITDAMVALLQGQDDTLVGVLGHELGHVRQRHGMRALVQFTLIGAASGVALGDFSALLAGVPALIGQLGYSRDAEREADAEAAHLLRASGRSPSAMLVLFERLAGSDFAAPKRVWLPIALASHPFDEERARYFREAARHRAGPN